jgi:hypothetical protein
MHDATTVDVDGLTRDVVRVGAQQEAHHRGDLRRRHSAAEGNRLDRHDHATAFVAGAIRTDPIDHVGFDRSRAHRVHRDPMGGDLAGQRLREADHSGTSTRRRNVLVIVVYSHKATVASPQAPPGRDTHAKD